MENTDTNVLLNSREDHECVWATCPVTGRFVMDIADRTELNGPFSVRTEHIVRTHMTDLLQEVALHDARFRGKLIPSGSFYEGTKVTKPNEFDYMYELHGFPLDFVEPKHVLPPIYRPTQEETPHRGYFTLEVHPTTSESASNLTNEVMDAEVIFKLFFEALNSASRRQEQENIEETILSITNMKRNGPAVTLSFTTRRPVYLESQECPTPWLSKWFKTVLSVLKPGNRKHFHIKVDIVLAVPMLITNLKLNEGHIETNFDEEDDKEMHLVPSGNCWKLSVAKQESRLIRKLTGVDWRPQETVINCGERSNSNLLSNNLDANTIYSEEGISDDVTRPLIAEMESYGVENEHVHNQHSDVKVIEMEAYEQQNVLVHNQDSDERVLEMEAYGEQNERVYNQHSDERVREMEAYGEQNECVHNRHSNETAVAHKCRRSCLIALKHLRDQQESSDVMKKAILPTYPLKVAFVQECIDHPEDEDWTEDQLGGRVYNILDKVDAQSRDGSLTSCFLPNVPVLKRPNYNISKQVSSIKSTLHKDFKRYRCVSGVSIVACMTGLLAAGSIIYSVIRDGISDCCSDKRKTGKRCVFFNATYPCPSVHYPDRSTFESLVYVFAVVSLITQNIWYLAVTVLRMVARLCHYKRKLSFYCIPLGFHFIPCLAFAVIYYTGGFIVNKEHPDMHLVNIASLEAVYLVYEMACLIYICILRQRNQSISECFGPCRKLTRFRYKRPVEPYFECVSKYSKG